MTSPSEAPTLSSTIERVEDLVEALNRSLGRNITPYNPITRRWTVGSYFLRVTGGEWSVKKVRTRDGEATTQFHAFNGPDMENQLRSVTNG
jgi:hypothetical protein